jgi:hypothetical protein
MSQTGVIIYRVSVSSKRPSFNQDPDHRKMNAADLKGLSHKVEMGVRFL